VVRLVLIREVLKTMAGRFPKPEGEVGFGDGRLHSFRHFFCSLSTNRRIPQQVVIRWLGHEDCRMVEHYYHKHDDETLRPMGPIKLYARKPASPWPLAVDDPFPRGVGEAAYRVHDYR
jgi:hypothetical protein